MVAKTLMLFAALAAVLILQSAAQSSEPKLDFCASARCIKCTKCNPISKSCDPIKCPACQICGENGTCVADPAAQCGIVAPPAGGRPKRTTPIELCLDVTCDNCKVCNQTTAKCEPRRCRVGERCNMLSGNCEQNRFNLCKTKQCVPCFYCDWDRQLCVPRVCPFCQTCDKTVGECKPDPLLDCVSKPPATQV